MKQLRIPSPAKPLVAALLLPVLVTISLCSSCGQAERGDYDEFMAARQLATSGKYAEAAKAFEALVAEHPDSKCASRAGLFLGKVYMAMGELPSAEKWLQWTVDNHADTPENHKCRFKLAMCAYFDGRHDEAQEEFSALAGMPNGPLAAESQAWIRYLNDGARAPAVGAGQDQ